MGFRTEQLYGEGYKNPIAVMAHEIFELENSDILDTLSETILKDTEIGKRMEQISCFRDGKTVDEEIAEFLEKVSADDTIGEEFCDLVVKEIEYLTGHKLDNVLWLCDSVQDIIDEYEYPGEDEVILNSFDEYENGFVVLSDLGKTGKLFGYSIKPAYIRTVSRE